MHNNLDIMTQKLAILLFFRSERANSSRLEILFIFFIVIILLVFFFFVSVQCISGGFRFILLSVGCVGRASWCLRRARASRHSHRYHKQWIVLALHTSTTCTYLYSGFSWLWLCPRDRNRRLMSTPEISVPRYYLGNLVLSRK